MAQEKVKGEDSPPRAAINVTDLAGSYTVTAKHGIRVDGQEGTVEKGETVELDGDAARALLNEGSVERA